MANYDIIGLIVAIACLIFMVLCAINYAKLASGIPANRHPEAEKRLSRYFLICFIGIIFGVMMWYHHGFFEAGVTLAFASASGFLFLDQEMRSQVA